MIIANETVRLRAVEPSDLDFLYILENSDEPVGAGATCAPVSRLQLERYIESYSADISVDKQLRLIVEDISTGEAVGAVDITDYDPHHRHGYVGIAVAPSRRRRGYGRAALELLCAYAGQTLGMHSLCAVVSSRNAASRGLFGSCGFRGCGRLRSWLRRGRLYDDALLLQRLFA